MFRCPPVLVAPVGTASLFNEWRASRFWSGLRRLALLFADVVAPEQERRNTKADQHQRHEHEAEKLEIYFFHRASRILKQRYRRKMIKAMRSERAASPSSVIKKVTCGITP